MVVRRTALMGPNAPLFYQRPLQIVRGKGVWLYDADGRRYLDAYNNVPHVGHCNSVVVKAVSKQLAVLNLHTRYLSAGVLDYHERLLATFPSPLSTAMLTCTGSEANELALRIARQATGRTGVIVTQHTYHGNTAAVSDISTAYASRIGGLPAHVRTIRPPQRLRAPAGLDGCPLEGDALKEAYLDDVRRALDDFKQQGIGVAALLVDTIFSTEGLPDPPAGWLHDAVALVRNAGGVYIADEVQPGLGRTGAHWWGYEAHGVVPDIVTMGKSMGNGYPLAGLVARADLVRAFREQVMYFNTFGANHVACAAGSAVLRVIEDDGLIENAATMGALLAGQLRGLMSEHACIGDVRGRGLFIGAEIVRNRERMEPDPVATKAIVEGMKNAGVLISSIGEHENVLKIRPPMVFGPAHVKLFVRTLHQVLTAQTAG